MKIISAVPFHIETGGEIIEAGEPGFHPLIPGLRELGQKTRDFHKGAASVDAIPSSVAHMERFKVDMTDSSLKEGYWEKRWRTVIAVMVLSSYRIMDLEFEQVRESDCNTRVKVVFWQEIRQSAGTRDAVCILKLNKKPLAVLDRDAVLIPAQQWPEEEGLDGFLDSLEPYEKDILFTYLCRMEQARGDFERYAERFLAYLKREGAKEYPGYREERLKDPSVSLLEMEEEKRKILFSIPRLPIKVPYPFYSRLYLTVAIEEEDGNGLFGGDRNLAVGFSVKEVSGLESAFTGLIPLSKEMADLLETSEDVELAGVETDAEHFMKNKELKIYFRLKVRDVEIKACRLYTGDSIVFINAMPTVGVFPYVNIAEEKWLDYNLILYPWKEFIDRPMMESVNDLVNGDDLDIDLMEYSTRQQDAKSERTWYFAKSRKLPRYIQLCVNDNMDDEKRRNLKESREYIGSICVGAPHEKDYIQDNFNLNYRWAIDMGTSSTITALKQTGNPNVDFTFVKSGLFKILMRDSIGSVQKEFSNRLYAPLDEKKGKFSTMGVAYRFFDEEGECNCYEQGCALFPDIELLAETLSVNHSLYEKQIVTNIKFGKSDPLNQVVLRVYLKNMIWLGTLQAILKGASQLKILVSYPREEIYGKIRPIWDSVIGFMDQRCGIGISVEYYTEAEANYRYIRKEYAQNADYAVGKSNVYGILDIGDGTTDMNLFMRPDCSSKTPKHLQFSVRYAGGETLIKTILDCFRKDLKGVENLWELPTREQDAQEPDSDKAAVNEAARELLSSYAACVRTEQEKTRDIDASGQYATEDTKRMILLMLLEKKGLKKQLYLSETTKYKNFLTVMKFKYMNLMKMYGLIVRDYHAVLPYEDFKLFLLGGGRKGLSAITGGDMKDFHGTKFGEEIRKMLAECLGIQMEKVIIISNDTNQKNEIVVGMVDETIKDEQRERIYKKDELESLYRALHESEGNLSVNKEFWSQELMEELKKAYLDFISVYEMNPQFVFEPESEALYDYISIKEGGRSTREKRMRSDNRTSFENSAKQIWDTVCEDKENPECLLISMFCMRMAEHLLMKNFSS